MPLSLERGIHVGAFVFFLAGAVRLTRLGQRTVVQPGSKTMSRWILGFPRNLGSPGDNTPHDTDCIGRTDPPMVCAEALLKLARWCWQRRQSASGGEPCPTSWKIESPPARTGGGDVCGAGATLDGPVTDHASECPSSTESSRRSATANSQDWAGGDA